MIINIDLEGLSKKREELKAELDKVDGLILLVNQFSSVQAPTVKLPQQTNGRAERHLRSGKRKAITTALHTGPATEQELAAVLSWEVREVKSVVNSMLLGKLVYLNEFGKLQLSPLGQKQAVWFSKHPEYQVYCPERAESHTHAKGTSR